MKMSFLSFLILVDGMEKEINVIDDISFDKVVRSSAVDFNSFKTSTLDSIRALRLIERIVSMAI